ncbi:hypothetical protein AYJ54_17770 [Bradyrhizobium centrolobii]|uniref:Uncharacterized protein n=2 Tax=Bradyrhizobium TaxID=374 RepID=A0A176ZGV7_9BRAD|nr:hypothetical protein AYJ54_17770 [Bradyrhizobium centrolobii]OAF19729.1 hypothetical protein AXW67_35845 [Bradyrhizobium neotropicale]
MQCELGDGSVPLMTARATVTLRPESGGTICSGFLLFTRMFVVVKRRVCGTNFYSERSRCVVR